MARAMPVLPDVASIKVSPRVISPLASARCSIEKAGRSLTEPAGLLPSSLTRRVLFFPAFNRCKRTKGVFPTKSTTLGQVLDRLDSLLMTPSQTYRTLTLGHQVDDQTFNTD